jgi:hypothetical protein
MTLQDENIYEKTRFFPSSRVLLLALPPPYSPPSNVTNLCRIQRVDINC